MGCGWVGGARAYHYQGDFKTHSGSSERSLDSESKLEPSVAKMSQGQMLHGQMSQTLWTIYIL